MSGGPFEEVIRQLEGLGPVPSGKKENNHLEELKRSRPRLFSLEVGVGIEASLTAFAIDRHVTSELEEAFQSQYPQLSENTDLESHYEALLERGPDSAEGLIHSLRGKLFELRLPDELSARFPGWTFELSEQANQPGWDLVGTDSRGTEIFIQAKAREASAASDVIDKMEAADAPQFFAVTEALHEEIVNRSPELAERLLEIHVSHLELNEEARSALTTLSEHLNLDVPDGLTDALPYVGEVVLGVRLIVDVFKNEKALAEIPRGDRNRLHAVRVLTLMARFGIATVLTTAGCAGGTAVGSMIPVAGNAVGGVVGAITGAVGAGFLNQALQPRLLELGLEFAGLDKDDLFYVQHKPVIDSLGDRLLEQRKEAEKLLPAHFS